MNAFVTRRIEHAFNNIFSEMYRNFVLLRRVVASAASACKWNATWVQLQMKWGLLPTWGGTYVSQYLCVFNWAILTLVVVVIGDVVPVGVADTLWVTICIIFGVIVNAAIIGNIANLVANLEGAKVFREKR